VLLRDGVAEWELFGAQAEELWEQVRGELEVEGIALLEGLQDFKVTTHARTSGFALPDHDCHRGSGTLRVTLYSYCALPKTSHEENQSASRKPSTSQSTPCRRAPPRCFLDTALHSLRPIDRLNTPRRVLLLGAYA
jgi:hypothetical protein